MIQTYMKFRNLRPFFVTQNAIVMGFVMLFLLFLSLFNLFNFEVRIVQAVQATNPAPLFLWVRGDLWRYDPVSAAPPTQVTFNGTISIPSIAPTGDFIAYKAAAPVGLEALGRIQADGLIADFDLPADIYLLDTVTGESRLIAGQPDDAALFINRLDSATQRSAPVWSANGGLVAWAEVPFGADRAQIKIYQVETGQLIRDFQDDVMPISGTPPRIAWGATGILFWLDTSVREADGSIQNGDVETLIRFYNPGTGQTAAHLVGAPEKNLTVEEVTWVEYENGDADIAILYTNGTWQFLDELTALPVTPSQQPRLVSRTASDTSYSLTFGSLEESGFFFEGLDPLNPDAPPAAFSAPPARVTLSPDGREIALIGYPDFGAAAIYRQTELIVIPATGGAADQLVVGAVIWGAVMWRIG